MLLDDLPHRCLIRRNIRTKDALGGSYDSIVIEQTNVPCWEQAAGDREILAFQNRGMSIDRKIYFTTNPNVTTRHEIIVTKRNGVEIEEADQIAVQVMSISKPDAGAGLAALWRVMCNELSGENA